MRSFSLNAKKFDEIVEKFKKFVANKNSDGSVSFNDGWLAEQEGYKKKIPKGARERLSVSTWNKETIGTGNIIFSMIDALRYNPEGEKNNLVDWRRWRNIKNLISEEPEKTKKIEALIYRLYTERNTDEKIFDELISEEALGKKYDLISYLYFLKDCRRYLPNRPENFEKAFSILGEDFAFEMSGQCSWINYSRFFNTIAYIRELMAPKFDEKISLIDAHSFCWIIAHRPEILEVALDTHLSADSVLVPTDVPFVPSDESLRPKGTRQFRPIKKEEREKEERKNHQIGDDGELSVKKTEIQFLKKCKNAFLADWVYHASKEEGDGLGYDIISFTPEGKVKFIEVKTTTGGKSTKFFITDTELDFSKKNSDNYYLYRLHNFKNTEKEKPHYVLQGNMREKLALYPTKFDALPAVLYKS